MVDLTGSVTVPYPTDAEVAESLRDWAGQSPDHTDYGKAILNVAADRIEALARERDEIRRGGSFTTDGGVTFEASVTMSVYRQIEAQAATYRAALEKTAARDPQSLDARDAREMVQEARTALAPFIAKPKEPSDG